MHPLLFQLSLLSTVGRTRQGPEAVGDLGLVGAVVISARA